MKRITYTAERYDVAVIGAGHAGIEAGLAAARLGARTAVFSISLDAIGNMPCNPSIGGTAKGTLVREIDALGGEMAKAADATCIQFRLLGRGKGPAVRSPRAQADRTAYKSYMKRVLETTPNLVIKQAEVVALHTASDVPRGTSDERICDEASTFRSLRPQDAVHSGTICAVETALGAVHPVGAVVIATGTFLGGKIFIGEYERESGPDGLFPASELTESLESIGVAMRRFKTGTPPRVLASSVDFSKMEVQEGERDLAPFSFATPELPANRAICHLTYTNEKTHEIIRSHLDRSPLYGGAISGVGPRYCPSIEDKVVRFATRTRHPVFIEPTELDGGELYLQGLSSSLPEQVQLEFVRSIEGLENAVFTRPAYAIEYDCADPLEFGATLEHRSVQGLYGAGQFLGTSGYEEAAALGLLAGANAARRVLGREPVTIDRTQGLIGVMIDDLVTKGAVEPYRMLTSRSEHRLMLRQDNADQRLTAVGHLLGLVSAEQVAAVEAKYARVERELKRIAKATVRPSDAAQNVPRGTSKNSADAPGHSLPNAPSPAETHGKFTRPDVPDATPQTAAARIEALSGHPFEKAASVLDLLRRPGVSYDDLAPFDPDRPDLAAAEREQVEIAAKYEGYIARAAAERSAARRAEDVRLPADVDYLAIDGIRIEARQKLALHRPHTLGAASRLEGVTPADAAALMLHLEARRRTENGQE